jgi:hypothetical protein
MVAYTHTLQPSTAVGSVSVPIVAVAASTSVVVQSPTTRSGTQPATYDGHVRHISGTSRTCVHTGARAINSDLDTQLCAAGCTWGMSRRAGLHVLLAEPMSSMFLKASAAFFPSPIRSQSQIVGQYKLHLLLLLNYF